MTAAAGQPLTLAATLQGAAHTAVPVHHHGCLKGIGPGGQARHRRQRSQGDSRRLPRHPYPMACRQKCSL